GHDTEPSPAAPRFHDGRRRRPDQQPSSGSRGGNGAARARRLCGTRRGASIGGERRVLSSRRGKLAARVFQSDPGAAARRWKCHARPVAAPRRARLFAPAPVRIPRALCADAQRGCQRADHAADDAAPQDSVAVQSLVPQHAELFLLLSMVVPVPWLERVPTYKEQQENLKDRDLSTYGFLGYPLLQTADVAMYDARFVPVGADQVAHLELSREAI